MQDKSVSRGVLWRRISRILIGFGVLLIVPALIVIALQMLGVIGSDLFALGATSGIRVVASVAVFGCLMAAIGYWER